MISGGIKRDQWHEMGYETKAHSRIYNMSIPKIPVNL